MAGTGHRICSDLYLGEFRGADPGDTKTIAIRRWGELIPLISTGVETRTMADPGRDGIEATLMMYTDGGDITVTFNTAYDEGGNTTAVFSAVGEYMGLYSIPVDYTANPPTFAWRVKGSDNVAGPVTELVDLNGNADALVLDADGDTTISSPTDDQIDFELAGADDFTMTANSFNVLTGSDVNLADSAELQFGASDDVVIAFDGTTLTSGSSIAQGTTDGLWSGCPSVIDPNPYRAFTFFDDFMNGVDLATDYILTTGAGGTISYDDTRGGILLVPTAVTDNDHMGLATRSQCFNLVDTKELWFEARFRVVESNTNESAWWFGLSDTLTTGGLQVDALGPLASYDGVLMWKDEGTMLIDAETSNASSQDTETNLATFVTNTWTRVGFHVSAAATTAVVHFYFDVGDTGVMTAHSATANLTRSGLQEKHVIFGIKSGPTSAVEPLEVDYVKCVQIR